MKRKKTEREKFRIIIYKYRCIGGCTKRRRTRSHETFKEKICTLCMPDPSLAGQPTLFEDPQ